MDIAGDIHSLARQIQGALKKDVDARLSDVDPASVPRATHVQQQKYFAWKESQPKRSGHPDPKKNADRSKDESIASGDSRSPARRKRDSPFDEVENDPLDPATILKALTRNKSTFTESDLRWEVGKRLKEPTEADGQAKLEKAVTGLPEFLCLGPDFNGRQRFSSKATVAIETAMATAAEQLSSRFTHQIGRDTFAAAPSAGKLTDEQRAVSEYTIAPGALKMIEGIAGGGKSTTMRPVNEAAIAAGYRTRGLAVAGIAAQGLQDSTGIASGTLMSFIQEVERIPHDRERLALMDARLGAFRGSMYFAKKHERDQLANKINRATLSERDIIILDEAGMVGTRQMNTLLTMAATAGAKVVLIGDSEQLQAIDAGGPFRFLTERHGAAKISEVWRQKDDWQKQATRDFRDGETPTALQSYRDAGRVHEVAKGEDARERVLADWSASRARHASDKHLMLAFTNDDVNTLNDKARRTYKSEGKLEFEQKVKTEDGSLLLAKGERVYFLRNSKMLQVMNGTLGTVEALERVGDTDEHKITVRVDKGDRIVQFSTKDYSDLTHGYAATIHKTQGATADRAIVLASAYMDRHATYVAMSRHIHQADMYYSAADFDSFAKLETKLSREARKDMALDYLEATPKAEPKKHEGLPKGKTAASRPRPAQAILHRFAAEPKELMSSTDRLARAKATLAAEQLREILGKRPDKEHVPDFGPGV